MFCTPFIEVNARTILSLIESGNFSFMKILDYTFFELESDDQVFDIIYKLADNYPYPLLKSISHSLKNYLSKINTNPENYLIDELKSEKEMLKESMSDIIDQKLQNITKMFESLNYTIKENFCMTNSMIAEDKTPQIIVQGHDSDTVKNLINKAVSEKETTIFELQNEILELKSKSLLENSSPISFAFPEKNKFDDYIPEQTNKDEPQKEKENQKAKNKFAPYIPDQTEPPQSNKEKVIDPNLVAKNLDDLETFENPRTVVPDFEQILEVIKSNPNSVPRYKDYVDMYGNNLFIYAVWRQLAFDEKWLNKFIKAGYDVNFRGNYGRTVLWWACEIGVRKTIEYLLKLPNIQYIADDDGVTPYRIAAINKRTGALRILEGKGYRK